MTVQKANELGKSAFIAGKKCVPACDAELMAGYKGLEIGKGIELSKSWLNGWMSEQSKIVFQF